MALRATRRRPCRLEKRKVGGSVGTTKSFFHVRAQRTPLLGP